MWTTICSCPARVSVARASLFSSSCLKGRLVSRGVSTKMAGTSMVRRLMLVMLVVGLCLSTRGFVEALESASHIATYGHAAHEEGEAGHHEHPDSEHGCVGHQHVCPCCASAPAVPPASPRVELVRSTNFELIHAFEEGTGSPGVRTALFRPPIASL